MTKEDRKKAWAEVENLKTRNERAFQRADLETDPHVRERLHSEAMNQANSDNRFILSYLDQLCAEAFNKERK